MYEALAVLVGLFVLAILAGIFVLPIVALVRTRRIGELRARVERLEHEVRRLRSAPAVRPVEEPIEIAEEAAVSEPTAVRAAAAVEEIPSVLPVHPQPAPGPAFAGVEAWIGVRALGWVAVVLLVFATGFFLQQLVEHDLIGEVGRVSLGLAAGAGLCCGGFHYHRRGWRVFSQMLTAAGIVLIYLSTFAAFGYYRLLPQGHAVYFLIALVLEAAALAVLYDAPAIAIMAVLGGLLAPVLLPTDRDRYPVLFTYLAVLNAGVVVLGRIRPSWPAVGSVALAGTQILFWGWFVRNYHPDKLAAALAFQAVVFALHLAGGVLTHVHGGRRAGIEELCRLAANGFLFALAAYILLDPEHRHWLGTLAIALAVVYAGLARLVQVWRPDDARQVLVCVATAMGFVAAAFPLEAGAAWAPLGWAAQGLALWWFGLRLRGVELQGLAVTLFGLAVVGVLVSSVEAHREPFLPLLNRYALPALAVCACLLAAPSVTRRLLGGTVLPLSAGVGLAGVGLLWVVLSVEAGTYFFTRADRAIAEGSALVSRPGESEARQQRREDLYSQSAHLRRTGLAAVSVVWAAYAAGLLAVGFRLRQRPLRWAALGLFGVTLGKVVLVDTAHLAELYRAAVFLVLALMMAAGAWGYQKVARRESADGKAGEASRETV